MNIKDFYNDKTILLTGATGFVGKVVLEKFMRTLPNFKRIYVMLRPKKKISIQTRLQSEIFDSEIFSTMKAKNLELFYQTISKIVPVAGDLILEELGMDTGIRSTLLKECDVIINCAASINFNDPLLEAI